MTVKFLLYWDSSGWFQHRILLSPKSIFLTVYRDNYRQTLVFSFCKLLMKRGIPLLMVIWAQTFLDKAISWGLILSLHISLRTSHSQRLPNKVSDHWRNVSCFWRFDCFCVFTCRGAERKRELHVLLKVLLDTPHPTSPCTINFIFGVLSRGSLAKQHDRKTVQNPEAQGGN